MKKPFDEYLRHIIQSTCPEIANHSLSSYEVAGNPFDGMYDVRCGIEAWHGSFRLEDTSMLISFKPISQDRYEVHIFTPRGVIYDRWEGEFPHENHF